jgi:hypothetical protein
VPALLTQPQGESLAALTTLQGGALVDQTSQEDWSAFGRYVLKYLRAQSRPPSHEIPQRPHATLSKQDFYAWIQATAAAIRAGTWETIDREALAEEIDGLGISQKHALGSHLRHLVMHLLKWRYESSGRQTGHSWRASITNARDEIAMILEGSPSLRRTVPAVLARRYPAARCLTQDETGLPLATFPETCPWTPEQVLDPDFWPED